MDRGHRAALALAAPLAAVPAAWIGAEIADAASLAGPDERFVAVALPIAATLTLARVLRPDSARRWRVLFAALALPLPLAILLPRSVLLVTWLSGGVLVLGADAMVYAVRCAVRLGSSTTARAGLGAFVLLPTLYLWSAAAVVLVNTQLAVAPVRLFHRAPTLDPGEETRSFRGEGDLEIEGTWSPAPRGPVVVIHHGVSDGRERFLPWARRLRREGLASLRFDARAHGRSDGAVCTYGQREAGDLARVVAAVRARVGPARPIAVVGTSMGGGTVLAASRRLRALGVGALVVMAPAARYGELVVDRTAVLGPLRDPVLNASARLATAMGQIPMTDWLPEARMDPVLPVLVLHGTVDGTIPIEMSRRLAATHDNVSLRELEGVGHDEIPGFVADDDAAWAAARAAIDRAGHESRGRRD